MADHPAQSSDIEQALPAGFRVAKWLGVGNFGKVCRAKGQGGFECAFKIIEMNRGKAVGLKEFRALRVIRRIKPHRNLIEYLGVWLVTGDGEILDNADKLEDDDLAKLDVAELIIQMPLAVKSLDDRLKECRREFRKLGANRQPGDLPGIPLPELLPYMRGVAEALDHLHSPIHPLSDKGLGWIMHRDIKPANLLINRAGDVLVADYGVARAVGTNVKSTQSGAGTPIYSAPEQITDRVDVVDPASDQYSLAITYYELRTGALPFADDVYGDVNSLKLAHTLGKLDFTLLPRNELNVLKQATNRTVKRRYPSCVEFVDELWRANGVVPMQSGFIQRPAPRVPQSDSSPEIGLAPPPQPMPTPETQAKTGSRTPFELGTVTDMPPALQDLGPPPPPSKPSGTLLLSDMIRSTPFQSAPYPSAAENPLPLAEPADEDAPANPWDQPSSPKKSKPTIDLPPEATATPWEQKGTQKKSKPAIDLPPEPAQQSWHGGAPKPRSRTLLYVGVGVVLAALVAVGVFISINGGKKDTGPAVADNGNQKTDAAVTTKDPVNDDKKIDDGAKKGGANDTDPKKKVEPTPHDYQVDLESARNALALVGDGDAAAIDSALAILKQIPDDETKVAPQVRREAKALGDEWTAIRKLPAKPTLAEAERLAKWEASKSLAERDRSPLRRVYERLQREHPTAAIRFEAARGVIRGRDLANPFAAVLGARASALGLPAAGIASLDDLVQLGPPEPIKTQATVLIAAWTAALDFDKSVRTGAGKSVPIADITAARDTIRVLTENKSLDPDDRVDLQKFYRVRLASLVERFAMQPRIPAEAKAWQGLKDKLPEKADIDSPWLGLLKAECEFLAAALADPPGTSALAKLPAAAGDESPELAAYRKLLDAELAWHNAEQPALRRESAEKLLAQIAGSSALLEEDARKRALAAVCSRTARELKQPVASPDTPYAANEAETALARRCLLQANAFLKGSDASLRRELLRAAAFPKVDADAAKAADLDAKAIETAVQSLNDSESAALWLAFARTRDRSTAAGASDALTGFEKVAASTLAAVKGKPDADLAPLVRIAEQVRDRDFLSALPDGRKADAGEKLFLPFVKELLPRRAKLKPAEKTLLANLAKTAAELTKNADLEAFAWIIALEAKGERLEVSKAEELHVRADSAKSQALLGLVQCRAARTETGRAKRELLTRGSDNLDKAIELLKKDDPEKIADLLYRDGLSVNLELGESFEKDKDYKNALAAFAKAESFAKDRPELADEAKRILLPRARARWSTAANATDPALKLARTDLDAVAKLADANLPEARYWLALIDLYEGGLLGSEANNYESSKTRLVREGALDATKRKVFDRAFANLPESRTPFGIELLEWQACAACARANAVNAVADKSDRATARLAALDALGKLAEADPLAGAHRRLQFLDYRLQTAASRASDHDDELKLPLFDELWRPAAPRIAELRRLAAPARIPESLPKDRILFELFKLHATLHRLSIPELKRAPDANSATACLDAMLAAAEGIGMEKARQLRELEEFGQAATLTAYDAFKKKDTSLERLAARCAAGAWLRSARLDSSLRLLETHHAGDQRNAAGWRTFVAKSLLAETDPAGLKADPALLGEIILADKLMAQGEHVLSKKTGRSDMENKELEQLLGARENLIKKFGEHVDAAIDAMSKTNPGTAAEWREWKKNRSAKPQ